MNSPNKPGQTAEEAAYVAIVATLPCACCQSEGPREVHEFEQGQWFTSVPLCVDCHRGGGGWHGTRSRWYLHKMTMLDAIESTVRSVFRIVLSMPLQASSRRVTAKEPRPSKLTCPSKRVPRRLIA